jgi:hypothetical protein
MTLHMFVVAQGWLCCPLDGQGDARWLRRRRLLKGGTHTLKSATRCRIGVIALTAAAVTVLTTTDVSATSLPILSAGGSGGFRSSAQGHRQRRVVLGHLVRRHNRQVWEWD